MSESSLGNPSGEQTLKNLLAYPEQRQADDFTLRVMRRLAQERKRRQVILGIFGAVGAAFGLAGAWLLSGPIQAVFSGLPMVETMQAVLLVTAAITFYGWAMNEDLGIAS